MALPTLPRGGSSSSSSSSSYFEAEAFSTSNQNHCDFACYSQLHLKYHLHHQHPTIKCRVDFNERKFRFTKDFKIAFLCTCSDSTLTFEQPFVEKLSMQLQERELSRAARQLNFQLTRPGYLQQHACEINRAAQSADAIWPIR